jgi:endo-1,4-beta-D-glucanase Y
MAAAGVRAATLTGSMRSLSPLALSPLSPLILVAAAAAAGCAATPTDPYGPGGGGGTGGEPTTAPPMVPTPFGSHRLQYPAGTIRPKGAQADLDAAVAGIYDAWKSRYLIASCGGQVIRTGGGTGAGSALTVSEGHGYGMMITAIMAGHDPQAQQLFDGLYQVFRSQPSNLNRNLMAWAIGSDCKAIQPATSATDGDLDIAFALMLANRQWGSAGAIDYAGEARRVIAAIGASEMNATTGLPLLGDWARQSAMAWATRPSDFMLDHFRAFGALTGSAGWTVTVDKIYALADTLQTKFSPATGLLPDFVTDTQTSSPRPPNGELLESDNDDDYGWNSCRVPWRFGTDWVVSGDPRAKQVLERINRWIKNAAGGDPKKVIDGYRLDGGSFGGGDSAAFIAPFGVAALVDASHQDWLDAIWTWLVRPDGTEGYYADSIKLLSLIVMSGNWWSP